MAKPQIQQSLATYFQSTHSGIPTTESYPILENLIADHFNKTLPNLVRPKETNSNIQTKPRGYKSGIDVKDPHLSDKSTNISKQYKLLIGNMSDSPTGLLFADVQFNDKTSQLFKKNNISVTTSFHHSSIVISFKGNEIDSLHPILLCNLHEDQPAAFWKAVLGTYINRSYISNYRKKKHSLVARYYPSPNHKSMFLRINIVNKGSRAPPKRIPLKTHYTHSMNIHANKNIGGRILLIKRALSHTERIGLALVSVLQTIVKPGGETKGNACRINGKPSAHDILRTIEKKPYLASTGCKTAKVTAIKITENSARMEYVGESKFDSKSFQCAKFFSRHIFKSSPTQTLLERIECDWNKHHPLGIQTSLAMKFIVSYLNKLKTLAVKFFPEFVNTFRMKTYWNENLDLASNVIDHQVSTAHLHMDTKSSFPAILTAMNPTPINPWEGGELFISNGACILNYAGGQKSVSDFGDVIIMDADQLAHSVLPMKPVNGTNPLKMARVSHVLYNNGPKKSKA